MAVVMTISAGTAFMAGGVIALMPQLWFVLRGTSPKATLHAGGLALGKFSLSAAGFALWFAFVPTANPVLTLAGTATALLLSAVLMAGERWHAKKTHDLRNCERWRQMEASKQSRLTLSTT